MVFPTTSHGCAWLDDFHAPRVPITLYTPQLPDTTGIGAHQGNVIGGVAFLRVDVYIFLPDGLTRVIWKSGLVGQSEVARGLNSEKPLRRALLFFFTVSGCVGWPWGCGGAVGLVQLLFVCDYPNGFGRFENWKLRWEEKSTTRACKLPISVSSLTQEKKFSISPNLCLRGRVFFPYEIENFFSYELLGFINYTILL